MPNAFTWKMNPSGVLRAQAAAALDRRDGV
jgi:hypothetical protein